MRPRWLESRRSRPRAWLCDTAVVTPKARAWRLISMAAVVCAVSAGGVWWYRSRAVTPAAMLKRMPVEGALLVYIDFSQLRSGGILQRLDRSKVGEDPEYQTFVRRTGFDYKRDLDLAIVSVAPT